MASPHDGRAVTELSRRSLAKPARDSTNNSHAMSAPTAATIGRVQDVTGAALCAAQRSLQRYLVGQAGKQISWS